MLMLKSYICLFVCVLICLSVWIICDKWVSVCYLNIKCCSQYPGLTLKDAGVTFKLDFRYKIQTWAFLTLRSSLGSIIKPNDSNWLWFDHWESSVCKIHSLQISWLPQCNNEILTFFELSNTVWAIANTDFSSLAGHIAVRCWLVKESVSVISSVPSCKEGNSWFTTVPLKPLCVSRVQSYVSFNVLKPSCSRLLIEVCDVLSWGYLLNRAVPSLHGGSLEKGIHSL